jgi:pyrroline-5-carboxylate reductase
VSDGIAIARLAVIGAGKLGTTLIRALVESGVVERGSVVATARHPERLSAAWRDAFAGHCPVRPNAL